MILVFGLMGFLLVQVALTGLFSLTTAPAMGFVTMLVGLAYVGMAFSESRYRRNFPYAMAAVLALEGIIIIPLSGSIWWSVLHFIFALASLAVGMRLASPELWEDVLHPVHALRTRVLHR